MCSEESSGSGLNYKNRALFCFFTVCIYLPEMHTFFGAMYALTSP